MSIALALGGGGSRGDFQVGAVQYLYERIFEAQSIHPDILCGTSSGSILAAKLCEGEREGNNTQGLKGLVYFWHNLNGSHDMWTEEPWFANLSPDAQQALGSLQAAGVSLLCSPVIGPIPFLVNLVRAGFDFQRLLDDLQQATTAKSLYNINPVRDKLSVTSGLDPALVRSSGIILRMTTIALESGALRYVTQDGHMLERDLVTPVYGSITYAPECQQYAQDLQVYQTELLEAQEALANREPGANVSLVNQLQGEVDHARAELSTCEAQHPRVGVPLVVPLVDGIIASASIPTAFPPVKLGSENYVDGGVRDMVPIESAIRLGATRVYAVSASAAGVPPARSTLDGHLIASFDASNLVDIAGRVSMDIMTAEITRCKTDPPNGWGPAEVIVIEPDFDLHDIMTIDRGLIRIRMSHGYMRADDVIQAYAQDPAHYRVVADSFGGSRCTTTIIRQRRMIWEREYAANGWRFSVDSNGRPKPVVSPDDRITPDDAALEDVRRMKRDLKTLVDQRLAAGGLCPPGVEYWWMRWEEHDWAPAESRPLWDNTHPFTPLRHLQVAASPATIPVGIPVQVLVTATEGGAPVNNATVKVNGLQVGVTGTPFTHTFTGRTVRVFDPDTRTWSSELVDDVVTAQGDPWWEYAEEPVSCSFFQALLAAQIVSQSVPTTLTLGQTASVAVTVKNTGNVTWTPAEGYKLGSQSPQDNRTWGTNRIALPGPVVPGAQVTLTFNVTAPTTPGGYAFQWQMLLEGVQWFGQPTPAQTITVVVSGRNAEFVSQTVPTGALAGKIMPTTTQIIMRNTGTETWTAAAGYNLGSQSPQDNTTWRKNRIPVPSSVAPGQTVTFKFTGCYAPTTTGTYVFQWRMLKEGVEWFGPATPAVNVLVETL